MLQLPRFFTSIKTLSRQTQSFALLLRIIGTGVASSLPAVTHVLSFMARQQQRSESTQWVVQEALSLLGDCSEACSNQPEWRAIWQAELKAVTEQRASADVFRETVHFQAVSKQPSKLPAGKQIAFAIPYELPPADLTLFHL
jgi:hypothetical protein